MADTLGEIEPTLHVVVGPVPELLEFLMSTAPPMTPQKPHDSDNTK